MPNVLLVVLDTVRQDSVEPYGAGEVDTPALAELARRGTALRRAFATACWTLPSHGSIFTGLMPRGLGLSSIASPGAAQPLLERRRARLLPEVFRRAGYRTGAVSTNLWVSPHAGFDQGFDEFRYIGAERQSALDKDGGASLRATLRWARAGVRARVDDGAGAAGAILRDWIARPSRAPAFWFVNLVECHSPYLPPRPWNDLPPLERLRAALDARTYLSFESILRVCGGELEVPPAALERMRHLYGRAASYMDRWLADVLEALDRRGILDETLVLVTSDHGENFGENGLIGHACSLDDRLIRVPFVAAGPGSGFEERVTSLAELPRLLAERVGLPAVPWEREELPHGVALAEHEPVSGPEHPRMREFLERRGIGEEGERRLTMAMTAATDGVRKLVRTDRGEEFLYELDADPLEREPRDRSDEALRAALAHPALRAAPPTPEATSEELGELEQQMRLLGYL